MKPQMSREMTLFVGLHSSEIQEIYFKIVLSGSKEFHSVNMSRSLIYLTMLTVPTDDLDQPVQSLISVNDVHSARLRLRIALVLSRGI